MSDPQAIIAELSAELAALRARVNTLEESLAGAERFRQEAERYRALVETMTEGLAIMDENDRIQYANPSMCTLFGVQLTDVLGLEAKNFLTPDKRPYYEAQRALRREGGKDRYEITAQSKDGRLLSLLVSPAPIFTDGKFRGSFGVFTDLTAQKSAERALEQERSLLRALMDHIPDLVFIQDAQGAFVLMNSAQLAVMGATEASEVAGKQLSDFYPAEVAQKFAHDHRRVVETGQPLLNQIEQMQDSGGRGFWVLSSKVPLRDDTGAVTGMVGIARDITERKEAEEALASSEERLRLMLEHSRDVAYKLDVRLDNFVYVSPSVSDVLGYAQEEILGMGAADIRRLVHPEDLAAYVEHSRRLVSAALRREPPPLSEYRFLHKSGIYRWISESAAIVLDRSQQAQARIGTCRDITESKMTEHAVLASSRMEATATLAGGIAHDFNNLMAAVLANAELLEIKMTDAESQGMLAAIARAAEQAGGLAQQMLAFARGGQVAMAPVTLNDAVEDFIRLESSIIPAQISIDKKLSPELWPVFADRSQIDQIVMNLLLNAIESIEGEGRVTFVTRNIDIDEDFARLHPGLEPGNYAYLAVEDTGVGMAPDVRARVFEPFYSTKFPGRGLGLAAVYGIVKGHQGHISVYTEPGRGSIFKIYLPASEIPPSPKKSQRTADDKMDGSTTILVVDDEEPVLMIVQRILDHLGYAVLLAKNGQEGVNVARDYPGVIHAVLLDLAMPVMGGAEAFREISKLRPNIPVLICSGFELGHAAQSMLDQGARAFIQKPFRIDQLATELRQILEKG